PSSTRAYSSHRNRSGVLGMMRHRHRTALFIAPLLAAWTTAAPGIQPVLAQQRPDRPNIVAGSGFLLGQVVEADGRTPIAGAVVQLTVSMAADGMPAVVVGPSPNQMNSRAVVTNGSGYFLFQGLAKGSYSLNAAAIGHLQGGYGQLKPSGATHPIDLGEN